MKFLLSAALLASVAFSASAQTEIPNGFIKGTITLSDSISLSGYIKDNIRKDASVVFLTTDGKKKTYSGNDLLSVQQDNERFICIKGDFFKVISEGNIDLLQKSSDASGKVSYNGTEAIFVNGTEGKIGNHFLYNNSNRQLKLITKKNFNSIVEESFAGYAPAIDKAKTNPNDMIVLKEAVELFNQNGR